jgi:hypothetical protein
MWRWHFIHFIGTGVHLLLRQTSSGTTIGRIIFRMESCKNIQNSVSFTSSIMYCILVASWNATWQSVVDKTYYKYREFSYLYLLELSRSRCSNKVSICIVCFTSFLGEGAKYLTLIYSKDGGSQLLWNAGNHPPHHMM